MTAKTIAQKLGMRPGQQVFATGAPGDYSTLIGGLPDGSALVARAAEADFVHLFITDRASLAAAFPGLAEKVRPGTTLWISYPKRGPGVTTDITRDAGWAPLRDAGYDPVSQVAIDERWSALRFRQDPALRAARVARGARVGRD
jgi:hypothetical protein